MVIKKNMLSKEDAKDWFEKKILPPVIKRHGIDNKFEIREAWKDYIHVLYIGGYITGTQYSTWALPDVAKGRSNK